MNQTELSTAGHKEMGEMGEMLDATLTNENLVYGMLGVNAENCPVATGFVSPEQVEALYDLASKLYAAGEYKDADTLFQMLCIYKNNDARFWMGLGGCRQAQGDHHGAMEAYTATGYVQDFTSPQPLFFSALCLLRMNQPEMALQLLKIVVQVDDSKSPASKNPADQECRQKAQMLLTTLQAKIEQA